jgi:hypothetical protein
VKTRPSPRSTTARTSRDAVAASMPSAIPWITDSVSVLSFFGRQSVRIAIVSRSS